MVTGHMTNIIHGNYQIAKPIRGDLGAWSRWDIYLPTGKRDHVRVKDGKDLSPLYREWEPGNYDSRCPCCYLGHGHSEEYHKQFVEGEEK